MTINIHSFEISGLEDLDQVGKFNGVQIAMHFNCLTVYDRLTQAIDQGNRFFQIVDHKVGEMIVAKTDSISGRDILTQINPWNLSARDIGAIDPRGAFHMACDTIGGAVAVVHNGMRLINNPLPFIQNI